MARRADRPMKTPTHPPNHNVYHGFRMISRRSYRDVKNMLEANLLLRFLSTDRFENLRMQRENIKAMMDSPPLQAGEEFVST